MKPITIGIIAIVLIAAVVTAGAFYYFYEQTETVKILNHSDDYNYIAHYVKDSPTHGTVFEPIVDGLMVYGHDVDKEYNSYIHPDVGYDAYNTQIEIRIDYTESDLLDLEVDKIQLIFKSENEPCEVLISDNIHGVDFNDYGYLPMDTTDTILNFTLDTSELLKSSTDAIQFTLYSNQSMYSTGDEVTFTIKFLKSGWLDWL